MPSPSCLPSYIIPTLFYVDECIRLTISIVPIVYKYSHIAIMCNTYVLLTFARCVRDMGTQICQRQRDNWSFPSLAVQWRRLWRGLCARRWSNLHRLISRTFGCQRRVSNYGGVSMWTVSLDASLPGNSAAWLKFAPHGTRRRHCGYQRDLSGVYRLDRTIQYERH